MSKPNTGILATKDWAISLINKVIKKGFNGYSNNEKVIGTWTNGKPLYRKVISVDQSYTDGTDTPIATITDADTFTRVDAYLVWSDGSKQMVCSSGADDVSLYLTSSNELRFYNHTKYTINLKYAILEYTKSTD